ncbi:hypothetical protein GCM10023331_27500 [Algivirga pacifica]|uniref:Uncharacterized protein n=2 Tax=Algivirga pacifica TaxID=1162670 RepID=A0ABP9DHW6_9BACT
MMVGSLLLLIIVSDSLAFSLPTFLLLSGANYGLWRRKKASILNGAVLSAWTILLLSVFVSLTFLTDDSWDASLGALFTAGLSVFFLRKQYKRKKARFYLTLYHFSLNLAVIEGIAFIITLSELGDIETLIVHTVLITLLSILIIFSKKKRTHYQGIEDFKTDALPTPEELKKRFEKIPKKLITNVKLLCRQKVEGALLHKKFSQEDIAWLLKMHQAFSLSEQNYLPKRKLLQLNELITQKSLTEKQLPHYDDRAFNLQNIQLHNEIELPVETVAKEETVHFRANVKLERPYQTQAHRSPLKKKGIDQLSYVQQKKGTLYLSSQQMVFDSPSKDPICVPLQDVIALKTIAKNGVKVHTKNGDYAFQLPKYQVPFFQGILHLLLNR